MISYDYTTILKSIASMTCAMDSQVCHFRINYDIRKLNFKLVDKFHSALNH